jgi:large subunit ribosomal protein L1
MKRSKAYRQADEQIDRERLYTPAEAVGLAKKTSTAKFDPTVEVALRLGVDPRKADQMVRGTVLLPHGTGKTTPDLMGKVGRLGRVLGPRGLMPNPKTGTVTADVSKAVTDIKGGKIEFRVDRHGNLHFVIGKASFAETALVENYAAALDEVLRLKPSAAKGRYVRKVALTTTMGPSIPVDPGKTRGLIEDLEDAAAN